MSGPVQLWSPGELLLLPSGTGHGLVRQGPLVGWTWGYGIGHWKDRAALVSRAELTAGSRFASLDPGTSEATTARPWALGAATAAPLVEVSESQADLLEEEGLRVHWVGFDRVTETLSYEAKGGQGPCLACEICLVDLYLDSEDEWTDYGLVGRLLPLLSGGAVSEEAVELARALSSPEEVAETDALLAEVAACMAGRQGEVKQFLQMLREADTARRSQFALQPWGEVRRVPLPRVELPAPLVRVLPPGSPNRLAEERIWVTSEPEELPLGKAPGGAATILIGEPRRMPGWLPPPAVIARWLPLLIPAALIGIFLTLVLLRLALRLFGI